MDDIYYVFLLVFVFGFSFFMNYLTYNNFGCFLAWLMIFVSFFVWTSLFDLWILILVILVNVLYIGINKYNKRGM